VKGCPVCFMLWRVICWMLTPGGLPMLLLASMFTDFPWNSSLCRTFSTEANDKPEPEKQPSIHVNKIQSS
jgi:hypothetical protein